MPEAAPNYFYEGQSRRGIEKSYRVLTPKEWRQPGSPTQFVVLPWPWYAQQKECLKVIPQSRWLTYLEEVEKHPLHKEPMNNLRRVTAGTAKRAEFDGFGRLALSADLLRDAGIEKEADLLGCWGHFEIWEPGKLQQAKLRQLESAVEAKEEVNL